MTYLWLINRWGYDVVPRNSKPSNSEPTELVKSCCDVTNKQLGVYTWMIENILMFLKKLKLSNSEQTELVKSCCDVMNKQLCFYTWMIKIILIFLKKLAHAGAWVDD